MKYEGEMCYIEVIYDADFDCCIEIYISRQNLSKLMMLSFWRLWKHKIAYILVTAWSMKMKCAT